MPDGDLYEMNVDLTYAGQNCVNVHHFLQIGADGTGDPRSALHQMWFLKYSAKLQTIMVADVTIVQTRIRQLKPIQTQTLITSAGFAGTHTGDALPPHAACLLRQRGFPTGRKGTGGMKIVGVPTSEVKQGIIEVAYAALVQTYGDLSESNQADGTTGFNWRSCVFSQIDGVPRLIEKSKVTPRIVTVHSRQIGVGD